jgi:hypothetical protein
MELAAGGALGDDRASSGDSRCPALSKAIIDPRELRAWESASEPRGRAPVGLQRPKEVIGEREAGRLLAQCRRRPPESVWRRLAFWRRWTAGEQSTRELTG